MRATLIVALAAALCARSLANEADSTTEAAEKEAANKEAKLKYEQALNRVVEHINRAAEKTQSLIDQHMAAVDKDPGALITKETMRKIMDGSSFLPQKEGTRTVSVQSDQGFNGLSNYQPSGWKIIESMAAPIKKKEESSTPKEHVYIYPVGVGPVIINQCTEKGYDKASPCNKSKEADPPSAVCAKQIDAANFIGVGFDGRGYYDSQSRRASLVQRTCTNKAKFMGQDIPDSMNIFGIFETQAETRSFQSASDYMAYIRHKAGLSNQKNLFASEANKRSGAISHGVNLGGLGALVGGAIGAFAGGPAGAAMGAAIGGAVGETNGGGSGHSSGESKDTDSGNRSSSTTNTDLSVTSQGATHHFFAIMYVKVILYEITLDEVKPKDISLAALRDYMNLPVSYYTVGADVRYQNFLLRWGTHFIRSGKFGGQLKIIKTSNTKTIQSQETFARIAETEFQSMFATLQSKYSQSSRSWSVLGLYGGKEKGASQEASAKSNQVRKSSSEEDESKTTQNKKSEFTQTTVEAQGGSPAIAEALVDFYTPAFKQLYHDWLASIKDYVRIFEFQLKSIDEIFNMRMNDLFPGGSVDFGCLGSADSRVDRREILVEPVTKKRYYIEVRTNYNNGTFTQEKLKVYCKYSDLKDLKLDLERRRNSLERAVVVYMQEGPFPTSSFELKGGDPGCEEATLSTMKASMSAGSEIMTFDEMKKTPFLVAFDMPQSIADLIPMHAKYRVMYRAGLWFTTEPTDTSMHIYDGCELKESKEIRICTRNIVLTYDEKTGFLRVDASKFWITKARIPSLPTWLAGSLVARVHRLETLEQATKDIFQGRAALPCNIKWMNSHRLDPKKEESCIHFTAASDGDIFVIFSAIPKDHTTWYYLQINSEGASFYHAMKLEKRDVQKGMGILGNSKLFQSFFVCVIQKAGLVTMQYGKADPDSEVGTVFSGYTFVRDNEFSRLSFYTFGSGSSAVSLMDIRLTREMPSVECLNEKDYEKVDGRCVLRCHAECEECNAAHDNKACHQCRHMRLETGGATKVTECLAVCPAGMTASSTSKGLCILCSAGTVKIDSGNGACNKCPGGSFSAAGAKECTKCSAGKFNDKMGESQCRDCAAGTYSGTGATACIDCPAGKLSASGQALCSPCPFGHFSDAPRQSGCKPCPKGFAAKERGQASCSKCPAGTSSVEGSKSCSNSCQKGEFSPRHGEPCKKCSPGTFTESAGSLECLRCSAGSYQPKTGQAGCLAAPKGTYVPEEGATSTHPCPNGTVNPHEGQSKSSACEPCQVGTYRASASECKKCLKGHFTSGFGSLFCSKCPKGHFASADGSSFCQPCDHGSYAPSEASVSCTPAPPGTYVSSRGSSSVTQCQAGTANPIAGQVRASDCRPCIPGRSAASGSANCSLCKPGTVAPGIGSVGCVDCPAGSFAKENGSSKCHACEAGRYASMKGSSECLKCPYGSIATDVKKTKCFKFGECYFSNQDFVSSDVSQTQSGKHCQSWSIRSCDGVKQCNQPYDDAMLISPATGNKCRSFVEDGSNARPWCYTTSKPRWEYCNIPQCGERAPECYKDGDTDFVSGKARTKSGRRCQAWETRTCTSSTRGKTCHEPNKHVTSANKVGNTCRTIPGDGTPEPWCYTTSSKKWEECDIAECG